MTVGSGIDAVVPNDVVVPNDAATLQCLVTLWRVHSTFVPQLSGYVFSEKIPELFGPFIKRSGEFS